MWDSFLLLCLVDHRTQVGEVIALIILLALFKKTQMFSFNLAPSIQAFTLAPVGMMKIIMYTIGLGHLLWVMKLDQAMQSISILCVKSIKWILDAL